MRVVFTGTSGTDKRYIIERFASFIREKHKLSVHVIDAEAELYGLPKEQFYEFLESIPSSEAARKWSNSLKVGITKWKDHNRKEGEPKFSFLSLHATYHVRSHLYCPLNWTYPDKPNSIASGELLEILQTEFVPDLFINLYDNVYSLQARIRDYPFRLIELLRWRNVETMMTDILANLVLKEKDRIRESPEHADKFKYERSPIVATRHPQEMLYQLISNEHAHRIYMAYPITEPRRLEECAGDDRLIRQVNAFRAHMRDRFVAFDPVTIDERPLKFLWKNYANAMSQLTERSLRKAALLTQLKDLVAGDVMLELAETDLWRTDKDEFEQMLCGPLTHYRRALRSNTEMEAKITADKPVIFKLPAGEVRRAIEEKKFWAGVVKGGEIDNQIARRDFRLIDQVDCIVIYRPTMNKPKGWELGGTRFEYDYAKRFSKPALVIRDKVDGPLEHEPFNTTVNPSDILEFDNLDTDEAAQHKCFVDAEARIKSKIATHFKGL